MKTSVYNLFLIAIICLSGKPNTAKQAKNIYDKTSTYLAEKNYAKAETLLNECIALDKDFIEPYITLAKLKNILGQEKEVLRILNKAEKKLKNKANVSTELYIDIAWLYYNLGQYIKAKQNLNFIKKLKHAKNLKSRLKPLEESIAFAMKKIKNPVEFKPSKLKAPLNKLASQSFPILTIDERTIIFTGKRENKFYSKEDIYISYKDENDNWSEPKYISPNINSSGNEGSCTISIDGKLLILASCYRKENYGSCDLYISYKKGNEWTEPKNLGPNINSTGWQSHPSLSSDNKTLYFVSERVGNYGKKDIWKSTLDENGEWTKAENLGPTINSQGREVAPFIHPNDQTLFFSSDRKPSLGKFDLYYSNYINGKWTEPISLPYPINNYNDQISIFITASGKKGYYSQGKQKNNEYYNSYLYEFDIPEKILELLPISYIKSDITDSQTKQALDVEVKIYKLFEGKSTLIENFTDSSFTRMLKNNVEGYYISIEKPGYIYESFIAAADGKESINRNFSLKKVESGQTKVIKYIFFDFDSYIPIGYFENELNLLISFLNNNPNISIELGGHTDEQGTNSYNENLSKQRSKFIYDYLIKAGINPTRLSYQGYGKSLPISDDSQINRRVEFKIIDTAS
jgi:OOP family OmpA-OmpF porin